MARKPRVYGISGIYHVILRGNNKQNIFNYNSDRRYFLSKLEAYTQELGIIVYAYCLMNNHVHILIGNASKNMSLLVQKIANSYVYYFNRKYDRCGHLFQGRFKSEPVSDDAYFKVVYRYILQNCEKAALGKMDKYQWNSYGDVINPNSESFVDKEYMLGMYGSRSELVEYLQQNEINKCMEYENIFFIPDGKALQLIKKLFHINSPYKLEQLSITEQKCKCRILKKHGLSINQISRLTGLSKVVIKKS